MTADEAKAIMQSYGWTWHIRKRRQGTPYIYAARRRGNKIEERYIAPLSKLSSLSKEDIIGKITK